MIKTPPAPEGESDRAKVDSLSGVDPIGSDPGSPLGVVQCFVDPEELRRLIATMAAIELVSLMIQGA